MNHSLTFFFAVANKAKQQRGLRAFSFQAFILRSVPASVAFEPRSNNKKRGVERGVLGGIEGGRKITRPARGGVIKLEIAGVDYIVTLISLFFSSPGDR